MLNDSFLKRVVCQRPHNLKDERRAPSCRPRKRDSGRYKSTTTSAQLRFSKSPCPTANIFSPLRVRWPTSGWKFAFRELYHPSNLLTSISMETLNRYDRMIARYLQRLLIHLLFSLLILKPSSRTFTILFLPPSFLSRLSFAPSSIAISRKKSSVTLPPSRNSWRVEGVEERRFEKGGRGKKKEKEKEEEKKEQSGFSRLIDRR